MCSDLSFLLKMCFEEKVREKFSRTCHFLCFMLYFNHLNYSNNIVGMSKTLICSWDYTMNSATRLAWNLYIVTRLCKTHVLLNPTNNIGLRRYDMKIYNVKYYIWGIIFLIPLPLFAFGSIKADWWQWLLSIGISVKYLSVGLSKLENERQERIEKTTKGYRRNFSGNMW